jgi:hypothetical protein
MGVPVVQIRPMGMGMRHRFVMMDVGVLERR